MSRCLYCIASPNRFSRLFSDGSCRRKQLIWHRNDLSTFLTRRYTQQTTNPPPQGDPHRRSTSKTKPPPAQEENPEELVQINDLLPASLTGTAGVSSGDGGGGFRLTGSPLFNAALTTCIGLGMVFMGGVAYVSWYKRNVLNKIERAFDAGYDPALELVAYGKARHSPDEDESTLHLRRTEQDVVDRIVQGREIGHYFMLLGAKGTGKTTMIYDAMQHIDAEGVSVCEAHPDLEVFRLRLGKALNYEYNEDSQTGLFQRRDPREGGPALDIERALNKLEKVALRSARKKGRPLVLILNNVHFFQHDDDGRNMLLQLQQRAEAWAESGILTMVFNTDDFWPFFVLRKSASRMHVLSIYDLNANESLQAARRMRASTGRPMEGVNVFQKALSYVGGRLSYINKVSRARDMVDMAQHLLVNEKGWLLSQIGLIPDLDDDVMDEQKWSSCSWLLMQEFVKLWREQEKEREEALAAGILDPSDLENPPLPAIPYWRCRQIMTRPDFLEDLDRKNIISIDIHHEVRPDSMLILQAAREVVEEDGFDEVLQNVRDRVDEIESLHRTRELTFKDLDKGDRIKLVVDKGGSFVVDGA
ncbi:hypothetical protein BD410DRAFT_769446 [Rickenella mellea]|uniref:Uncharacterized protein n=1 Tax=Rickenella mellea TaxID=50990 RepID=A0A4Y7Q868_9AGAM|nr:hypothetical protein BD410DRAFT_769446 [Rickenella mellea]